MKTKIEVNEAAAQFDGTKVRYMLAGWMAPLPRHAKVAADTAYAIPPVTICAWCDPNKTLTRSIEAAGYRTSHGICDACAAKL